MEILEDAIDIHVHNGPDALARRFSAYQLAEQARRARMRGIVLKSHHFATGNLATQVSELLDGISVWGGIALNGQVGGLNPEAVRMSAKQNTRVVWLPTTSARNHVDFQKQSNSDTLKDLRAGAQDTGYSLIDAESNPIPELTRVLEVVGEFNLSLATGHISPSETFAVLEEIERLGLNPRRVVINHPDSPLTPFTPEQQIDLAQRGFYLERVALLFLTAQGTATTRVAEHAETYEIAKDPIGPRSTVSGLVDIIRMTGLHNNILAGDLGQVGNSAPVEGLTLCCNLLMQHGLSEKEVKQLISENPMQFLGLTEKSEAPRPQSGASG